MKKVSFRLTALVLALALCLLPTAAGAVYLDKTELIFTVGEPEEKFFHWLLDDGETYVYSYDVSGCDSKEYGLEAWFRNGGRIFVEGTPKKAGWYIGEIVLKIGKQGSAEEKKLSIKIIINEKETPVPPTPTPVVPTVVDNVIYNAAPEHEQALIRGVREWCNVRAGAGTDSAVIGRANLGQQISLLRWKADESWCFVEFNGLQGWIAKQFILPIK